MPTPYFDFKKFRVWHDRSSMKVGTDGVLIGAWAPVDGARRILDIGCGCGLISLMAAQRNPAAQITGIDIDGASVAQARENGARSPFAGRLKFVQADLRTLEAEPFDCILSNPPFFEEDLLPPEARRAKARHTEGLSFGTLLAHARRLLRRGGHFSLIVPARQTEKILTLAAAEGFAAERRTQVVTRLPKPAKRTLLCLVAGRTALQRPADTLILTGDDGRRTPGHQALTADFYL